MLKLLKLIDGPRFYIIIIVNDSKLRQLAVTKSRFFLLLLSDQVTIITHNSYGSNLRINMGRD